MRVGRGGLGEPGEPEHHSLFAFVAAAEFLEQLRLAGLGATGESVRRFGGACGRVACGGRPSREGD